MRSPLMLFSAVVWLSLSCTVKSSGDGRQLVPEPEGAANPLPPSPVTYEPTSTSSSALPPEAGGGQPAVTATDSACYKGDPLACQIEVLIIQQTNAYRGNRGPLAGDSSLSFVARSWSATQAQRGNIGHDGFPNQRERLYSQEFGAAATADMAAENVAMSGYEEGSAAAIAKTFTDMWWNSPGHRANMVGNYKVIGVGMAKRQGGWYGTQIFGN